MYKQNKKYLQREKQTGVTFSDCFNIPVAKIRRQHHESQVRKITLNNQHLNELTAHIEGNGLKEPIVVSKNANGYIFLESGHHRLASYENLKRDTIPAYIADFTDELSRLNFLHYENDHEPALVTTPDDAVKALQLYKEAGYFDNLNLQEQKRKAMSFLSTHYKHFGNRKKGYVYESFQQSEGTVQIQKHTKASRTKHAEAAGYYAKSGDFDLEKKCWLVNGTTVDNVKQMLGNINMWKPAEAKSRGVVVFLTTGKKNRNEVKKARNAFKQAVKKEYNPVANKLKKGTGVVEINFIPEIVGDEKVETYKI